MFHAKHLAVVAILAATIVGAVPTSSSAPPGPKWNDKDNLVVSIDVPDADNFPMAAYALISNPQKKVAIILTGRKIDFGWFNWATDFPGQEKTPFKETQDEIQRLQKDPKVVPPMKAFWIKYMVAVTTDVDIKSWVKNIIPPTVKIWFTTRDHHVDKHGDIYLEVSKIRLIKFLTRMKIQPSRYQIFTQGLSTPEVTQGIKHAQHVNDWSWDLDDQADKAIEKCKSIVKGSPIQPQNSKRGECVASALTAFISRSKGTLSPSEVHGTTDIKGELDKYFANKGAQYRYYAGGPMTEYHRHLTSSASSISESVAMLQSFKRESNLLGVQFNHMLDTKSSFAAMDSAVNGNTRLFLVPTEISKGSPWAFTGNKLHEAFGTDPKHPVNELCEHFRQGSKLEPALFDLITAVYFKHPEIFPPAVQAIYTTAADGFVELKAAPSGSKSKLFVVGLNSKDPRDLTTLNKDLQNKLGEFLAILKKAFAI